MSSKYQALADRVLSETPNEEYVLICLQKLPEHLGFGSIGFQSTVNDPDFVRYAVEYAAQVFPSHMGEKPHE